jgi:hypothetical protein
MNEIKLLRTKQINDFMAGFDNLKEITVNEIEEGLKQILVETPGVEFEYGVDYQLNEATGDEDKIHELKKIHIFYTYIDEDVNLPRIGKMSYIVG